MTEQECYELLYPGLYQYVDHYHKLNITVEMSNGQIQGFINRQS